MTEDFLQRLIDHEIHHQMARRVWNARAGLQQ